MMTIRLIWTYMIIGMAMMLMASCATDDADYGSDVHNSDYMYNGAINTPTGVYEGVWFAIDNDNEPICTATLTIRSDNVMSFSSVPCNDVLNKLCELASASLANEGGKEAIENQQTMALILLNTAKSSVSSNSSINNMNTGNSNNALYFDVSTESMTFPLRGEWKWNDNYVVFDELTVKLVPRKSIAVFDIVNNQWGVFLYYDSAVLRDSKIDLDIENKFDLGYKFITTKRLE